MCRVTLITAVAVALLLAVASAKPPHLVYVLTDDLGWNYPGYQNGAGSGVASEVITPTLDKLAVAEGLRLNFSYMYKYCSPSRSSFLTGRYPWKMANTRCNFIPSTIPEGVDLSYNFLPKHLAKAGYISTHIGKWHLGFHTTEYTPVARGFNHSWGFLEGGEDHWTHRCGASQYKCNISGDPTYPTDLNSKKPTAKHPISNRSQNTPYPHYWDLWSQSTDNFPGGPLVGYNGTIGDEDTYSGFVFTDQAVKAIHAHHTTTPDQPMFIYLALHNTHAPIEAPERFVAMYNYSNKKKNTFLAMVSVVDESVANVTAALKDTGMWANTILIWTTDNGSPVNVGGSNDPLRGGKGHNWEGGVRVPTFVTGGALPVKMRGETLSGLIHVADWYATFSEAAGLGAAADPAGPAPSDSISLWKYITGESTDAPRTEIIHDHHMFTNASASCGPGCVCKGQAPFEMDGYDALGSIRVGKYKLIVGVESAASWFGMFTPNMTTPGDYDAIACRWGPCLFDIEADPSEHFDLASTHKDVVDKLWSKFNASNKEHHPRVVSPAQDGPGFCEGLRKHGGWVSPWLVP